MKNFLRVIWNFLTEETTYYNDDIYDDDIDRCW